MNIHDLRDRAAVVTGGAAGIGYAIAQRLVASGARVSLWDRDERALAESAKALGAATHTVRVDVADETDVCLARDETVRELGRVDALVCSAGITGPNLATWEYPVADWKRVMDVNVNGQFHVARSTVPHLKQNGWGAMVCMASVAGKYAFPLRSPYAASKAAVISFARSLSVELGPHKIRVNAIAPGVVAGERIRRVFSDRSKTRGITYEDMEEIALRAVSLKTMVEPEEIAELVLFLCAPTGRAITGQVHSICGGLEYTE